ncbi:hypothetical protein AB0451_00865 [Streptomyces sp. NPDC052000]
MPVLSESRALSAPVLSAAVPSAVVLAEPLLARRATPEAARCR